MMQQPPRISLEDKKVIAVIPPAIFPYPLKMYSPFIQEEAEEVFTLRVLEDEVKDLIRRYVIIYPEAIQSFEAAGELRFRCLVKDEESGVTRGILERIGYKLEESTYPGQALYWVEMKTREEIRGKNR